MEHIISFLYLASFAQWNVEIHLCFACISNFFPFCWVVFHCSIPFLGCFWFGAIMNKAVMNIFIQVFLWTDLIYSTWDSENCAKSDLDLTNLQCVAIEFLSPSSVSVLFSTSLSLCCILGDFLRFIFSSISLSLCMSDLLFNLSLEYWVKKF